MRFAFAVTLMAALVASAQALGNNHAVVIQGWMPHETSIRDQDELWNDCFLWYELMFRRPCIGGDSDRIHLLWGHGRDFRRTGDERYDPWERLRLRCITDDSAYVFTVESCFSALARESLASDDTLFVCTWGHGTSNWHKDTQRVATHFGIQVRPIWFGPNRWHGIPVWDSALARMTDPIPGQRVFVMQQCSGGGFTDDLADGRTTMGRSLPAGIYLVRFTAGDVVDARRVVLAR